MVEIKINTTQNVTFNFKAASLGDRILAWAIDWAVKIGYLLTVFLVIFKLLNLNEFINTMDTWSKSATYSILALPVIFYTLVFETFLNGQTLGKRILKIQVVKIDGYQASLGDFLIRWVFRIIDMSSNSGVVALIAIGVSSKNQRLGDIAADTAVISLKNNTGIQHTLLETLQESYTPVYPSVIKLSDQDARLIKETFVRAKKNQDFETIHTLGERLRVVLEIKTSQQKSESAFIDVVLKDYNYYTQQMSF